MSDSQGAEFLQRFACGWCLLMDMLRNRAMDELPSQQGVAMIHFTDAAEAYFRSSGLGELLGPYQTEEIRAALLKDMLKLKSAGGAGEGRKS